MSIVIALICFKSNHYTLHSMQNEIIWFVNHSTFCNCLRVRKWWLSSFPPGQEQWRTQLAKSQENISVNDFSKSLPIETVFLLNDGNAYLQTRRISAGINSLTTRRSVFAKVQEHECLHICKISLSRKSIFWWIKSNEC